MNCNNSVSIDVSLSYEEALRNDLETIHNDKMARPHTDNESSTGKARDMNQPPPRMDANKLGEVAGKSDTEFYGKYAKMLDGSVKQDAQQKDSDFKAGSRPGHVSDDGRSSISSDGPWRCKNVGSHSQPVTDLPQHKYHSSPNHQRLEHRGEAMVPHSSTVSYSSSKSSTPMKKSNSYLSNHTRSSIRSEGAVCRICHDGDQTEVLISPCYCAGSMGLLHISCLQRWLGASNKTNCEICNFQFTMTRRAKPITEFLKDPGTAKDRRNLICDIISFLVITPLTALTTWLSIVGAYKYYSDSTWEQVGLVALAVTLWCLYFVWFTIAMRHNWRLWKDWVMFHQDVTLICSPTTHPHPNKVGLSSEKLGSQDSSSTVHLQAIEIKVSGPVNQQKGKRGTKQSKMASNSTVPLSQGTSKGSSGLKNVKHDRPSHGQMKARSHYGSGKTSESERRGNYPETSTRHDKRLPATGYKPDNFQNNHVMNGRYLPETSGGKQGKHVHDYSHRQLDNRYPDTRDIRPSARPTSYYPDTKTKPGKHIPETNMKQDTYLPRVSSRPGNHLPEAKMGLDDYLPEANLKPGKVGHGANEQVHAPYRYDDQRYRKEYDTLIDHNSTHFSGPARDHTKDVIPAVWKTPECHCDTPEPDCDTFCDSAAIFSRGNSPEEGSVKTASQKYTEDWLDLKTVAVSSKADDSQQSQGTEGSYHTCSENRSPDKKEAVI